MLLAEELQEVLSTRFLALKVAPEPDWEAAEAHPTRGIQLHRILSQPPEGWQGTAGHIAPPLLKELMDSLPTICRVLIRLLRKLTLGYLRLGFRSANEYGQPKV